MTTFNIVTLASSIAGLSISGVTVQGLSATTDAVDPRLCPVLRPYPQAGFEIASLTDMSFGSTAGKKDLRYTMTWALYHSPVGDERGLEKILPDLWAVVSTIMDVLRDNDALAGAVDVRPTLVRQGGTIMDPANNVFHGALITLSVLEFTD